MKTLTLVASAFTMVMSAQAIAGCSADTLPESDVGSSSQGLTATLRLGDKDVAWSALPAENVRDTWDRVASVSETTIALKDGTTLDFDTFEERAGKVSASGHVLVNGAKTAFSLSNVARGEFERFTPKSQLKIKCADGCVTGLIAVLGIAVIGLTVVTLQSNCLDAALAFCHECNSGNANCGPRGGTIIRSECTASCSSTGAQTGANGAAGFSCTPKFFACPKVDEVVSEN